MKNTKFRRRALVSSVAMLLVALVALGSATFAWFTENPSVSASGINAKGQTSTGLKIKSTTDPEWGDTADLMASGSFNSGKMAVLTPAYAAQAASTYAITWLSAKAAAATASDPTGQWAPAGGDVQTVAATGNNDITGIYHEVIQIKATGSESGTVTVDLNGLSINGKSSGPSIKAGAMIMVAVDGKAKAWAKVGEDAVLNYASAAASTDVGSASGTYPNKYSTAVSLGTCGFTDATALTVDVYVYLDGTDALVYTNNVSANELIDGVSLSFTKHTS